MQPGHGTGAVQLNSAQLPVQLGQIPLPWQQQGCTLLVQLGWSSAGSRVQVSSPCWEESTHTWTPGVSGSRMSPEGSSCCPPQSAWKNLPTPRAPRAPGCCSWPAGSLMLGFVSLFQCTLSILQGLTFPGKCCQMEPLITLRDLFWNIPFSFNYW